MRDSFKKATMKEWKNGISCGDGWNSIVWGHTKKRTNGRKKIHRAARHALKQQLRHDINEEKEH